MAAKKKSGPKRKKQDVVEPEVTEAEVVSEDDLAQARNDGDIEDVSEEEKPKSKGKAKPASKKRGGKTRPADSDEEEEVEPPPKKGRGRPSKSGKISPIADDEEDVENGVGTSKASKTPAKGRGRPKKGGKSDIVEDADDMDDEDNEEDQPLAKRGKGKSNKAGNASSDAIEDDEEEDQSPAKKGKAGKPKKEDKRKSKSSANDSKKGKRGQSSSSKQPESDSGAEEEEREYEVDKILEVQFLRNGKREFLIKWKGYSKEDSTWEPEDHLDCKQLLETFMAKVEDNHISRPRRLSRRPTTVQATRISETRNVDLLNRVKDGRIDKANKRSSVSSTRSTRSTMSLGNVQNISRFNQNGNMLSSVSENVNVRRIKQRSTNRGILRAAVLSCGMVASLSAALLYSSPNSLSWDNISIQAQELITVLKDKFEVYYQQSINNVG